VTDRPAYVGIGECACARVDVQLYRVPGSVVTVPPVCASCLDAGRTAPMTALGPAPLAHVGRLDLGHGHVFEVVYGVDDQLVGWLHTHPDRRNPTAELCQSFCAVRPLNGTPVHQVVRVDPLTLSPSLLCRMCGAHGHVRDNQWEPCDV
jgi:hypothetical protein